MTNSDHQARSPVPSPDAPIVDTGSDAWQPDAPAELHGHLAVYLDRVSAMPVLREVAERTMDLLALKSGESILEVGCGVGVFLPLLAEAVGPDGRVVGIDHAPAMVAEARARIDRSGLGRTVTVEAGDAYRLPFPDASFDAAHCERVLIHLEDPVAALREMRRVVRPGGRIVAAEPDWSGMRIDHADREALAVLVERDLRSIRQPDMGLTLFRFFADAGLVERTVTPVMSHELDVAEIEAYGLDLKAAADELVMEGRLPAERAYAAVSYLEEASQNGTFMSYGVIIVVAGRVPSG